jgi:hypothetical protein
VVQVRQGQPGHSQDRKTGIQVRHPGEKIYIPIMNFNFSSELISFNSLGYLPNTDG